MKQFIQQLFSGKTLKLLSLLAAFPLFIIISNLLIDLPSIVFFQKIPTHWFTAIAVFCKKNDFPITPIRGYLIFIAMKIAFILLVLFSIKKMKTVFLKNLFAYFLLSYLSFDVFQIVIVPIERHFHLLAAWAWGNHCSQAIQLHFQLPIDIFAWLFSISFFILAWQLKIKSKEIILIFCGSLFSTFLCILLSDLIFHNQMLEWI